MKHGQRDLNGGGDLLRKGVARHLVASFRTENGYLQSRRHLAKRHFKKMVRELCLQLSSTNSHSSISSRSLGQGSLRRATSLLSRRLCFSEGDGSQVAEWRHKRQHERYPGQRLAFQDAAQEETCRKGTCDLQDLIRKGTRCICLEQVGKDSLVCGLIDSSPRALQEVQHDQPPIPILTALQGEEAERYAEEAQRPKNHDGTFATFGADGSEDLGEDARRKRSQSCKPSHCRVSQLSPSICLVHVTIHESSGEAEGEVDAGDQPENRVQPEGGCYLRLLAAVHCYQWTPQLEGRRLEEQGNGADGSKCQCDHPASDLEVLQQGPKQLCQHFASQVQGSESSSEVGCDGFAPVASLGLRIEEVHCLVEVGTLRGPKNSSSYSPQGRSKGEENDLGQHFLISDLFGAITTDVCCYCEEPRIKTIVEHPEEYTTQRAEGCSNRCAQEERPDHGENVQDGIADIAGISTQDAGG
mmetsp:Transcript_58422/g.123926  ORF Transcript_58422/g.123926 Transcript_58422/m.123926 type:complete len:470 (-) Transcript_58422:233-1642(-)